MALIKVNRLKKYYKDRLILDINDLEINEGDKVGLVGVNGCGKTTLLDIITSKVESDEGEVHLDRSYSYISQMEEEVIIEVNKVVKELSVPREYKDYLSGGEKVKARIAKALSNDTRVIIADEPTSNLDAGTIKIIEDKFKNFRGSILLVSHDREFLDNVCNKIIELDKGGIVEYNGNYSKYLVEKQKRVEREKEEYSQYISEKIRLENAIIKKNSLIDGTRKAPRRMGNSEARLHKMGDQSAKKSMDNAVKSLRSRINQLEVKEKPIENESIKIDMVDGSEFYSKQPIEINNITLGYGEKILIKDSSFKLRKGKKVALIGDNGVGKTSLISAILNNDESVNIANRVNIGYFRQDLKLLDQDKSIIENIKINSSFDETFIRIILASFLFKGDAIYKKVSVLSGGEKVKASLCKVILSDNNILILDEPTNYLDIDSMGVLEEALKNSNKTMIIISHDRKFISEVCNEVLEIKDKSLVHYNYSYYEYVDRVNKSKVSNKCKIKAEREMVINNRIVELISLMSIEKNEKIKMNYEVQYEELIKEKRNL
ncbi:MAG: ABC-F family ATP-binding cassette domain-containing protein [Clostridium sp.]